MRLGLILMLGAAALTSPVARAATPDAAETTLLQKAESCIRDNAAGVVSVAKTEMDAASFLVSGLCAEDIGYFQAYHRNAAMLAAWRTNPPKPPVASDSAHPLAAYEQAEATRTANILAALPLITVDPRTGEMQTPAGFTPSTEMNLASIRDFTQVLGSQDHFMTVAAEAVLAAQKVDVKP